MLPIPCATFELASAGTETLFNLAVLLQCEKGDEDGAIECYKRALELDPVHVASLANLANIYRERKAADTAEMYIAHIHITLSPPAWPWPSHAWMHATPAAGSPMPRP